MAVSPWSEKRLRRLFERYREQYWPRSRRLKTFNIQVVTLGRLYGRCDFEARVLLVNPSVHPFDREVRATVLHEMVHAIVGRGGHHAPFWTELEYLLSVRAPITVGFPELGERGSHLCIVPSRFKRCRRLFKPVYEKHLRAIERIKVDHEYVLTASMMEQECEDAAIAGASWRATWAHQVRTFGFVDLDGRLLPHGRPYREAGRRCWRRGKRFCNADERARARLAELRAVESKEPQAQ